MDKLRKIPRQGCSIFCTLLIDGVAVDGYVADVSASGFSFTPKSGELPDIPINGLATANIDMTDFSDIGGSISFEAQLRWYRGLLMGFEMSAMDKANFKRWWYLVYKLFFPSKH